MPLWRAQSPLVLASKSLARRQMLVAAGMPVEAVASDIDERAVENTLPPGAEAGTIALVLAREKARAVAARFPGRLVIGADQTLALGARRFSKPVDSAAARAQLDVLRGKTHALHSAVALLRDGEVLFEHVDTARLTMRNISDAFLDTYLDAAGDTVSESVGGYQLERVGIHLFERVEGDHFTILGMPLLPLLQALRAQGALAG
jgi:septum formation protein